MSRKELTTINGSKYNLPAILRMIDAEAKGAYGGSERTMIELVARLVRDQQAEIATLRAADNSPASEPSATPAT